MRARLREIPRCPYRVRRPPARGHGEARWRSTSAARTAASAATFDASLPAASVRMSRVTSSSPARPSPRRLARTRTVCQVSARAGASVAASSSPMRPAAPASATNRYRAPLSSRRHPRDSATARLTVPLPEPEGPSMVSTGTPVGGPSPGAILRFARSRPRTGRARQTRERGRHVRHVADPKWAWRRAGWRC